jgi:hypothetical protein
MDDRERRIRDRAHQLWLVAGQPDGHEVEHWENVVWHLTVRMRPFRQFMALNLRFFGAIFGTRRRPDRP